ncbi:hypothetical protein [Mangrovicella endophytica]|uniref:hypothetical protein n=1 Tax=Mangrovicella endophytica TaxID=2066697 RepID=UPI001FDEBB3C|nr:hypothetical protein [Mangrovicella endophytica]
MANGIKEVVAELRLVEVVDYIAFLRMNHYGNIADLVRSSSELHLKPGALRFANSGDIRLNWGSVPIIALDMEFHYEPITAHFRLELGSANAAVDISYLVIDNPSSDPEVDTARLQRAVGEARLQPTMLAAAH